MRTIRNLLVAAILLGLLVPGVAAAQGWLWGLTYEMSVPTGDLKDFAQDDFSWRGIGFEGRTFIREEVSAGFSVGWNVFHSKLEDYTWSQPGADVHGTQYRDVNAVPIFATIHWYWGQRNGWRPFLGLGAGTMYTEYRVDLGMYTFKDDIWGFAFAPELGVQLPYDRLLGYLAVRWHYSTGSGEIDDTNYVTFRVGIGLR